MGVNKIFSKLMGKGIEIEDEAIDKLDEIPKEEKDNFIEWILENNIDFIQEVDILKFKNIVKFPSESRFKYIDYSDKLFIDGEPTDWVKYFNSRYEKMKKFFDRRLLKETVDIKNLPEGEYDVKLYGLIRDKYLSKNGHMIITLEDPTGDCKVIALKKKEELVKKCKKIMKDSPIIVDGGTSDDGDALFINEIYTPSIDRKELPSWNGENTEGGKIIFTSDWHIGSKECNYNSIEKFVKYVNNHSNEILTVFHLGDLIDNVAIYPDQYKEVEIKKIGEQYEKASQILSKIEVPIVFVPGNHDLGGGSNKIPSPSLLKSEDTKSLYDLPNIRILSNPSQVIIDDVRILLTHGESLLAFLNSYGWNINSETVGLSMKKMLTHRHVIPEYGLRQAQHMPTSEDFLTIDNIPDIIATGHTHIKSYKEYKNIKMINPGCMQEKTDYMRRNGINPSPTSFSEMNLKNGKVNMIKVT
ncbi:MAG: metallophosphoesterase [archaeon]